MGNWLDEALRKAREEGHFDNLSGAGKPLNLNKDNNPYEDPAWRMAHRIMKEHEVVPAWIADRQDILTKLETARASLSRAWQWKQSASPAQYANADQYWERILGEFRTEVIKLNKRIFDFNLSAPLMNTHLHQIDVEREITKICQA